MEMILSSQILGTLRMEPHNLSGQFVLVLDLTYSLKKVNNNNNKSKNIYIKKCFLMCKLNI